MQQCAAFTAGGVSLRDVFPRAWFLRGSDIRIQSCCSDSRACKPGDLFVALVGPHDDGHNYAEQAQWRGATAVVAERPLPLEVPTCVVDDTRVAFGQIAKRWPATPAGSCAL